MRGWAVVAGLGGLAAAVTALLLWWRWRQFGAAWRVSWGADRHRGGVVVTLFLVLNGLGIVFNAGAWPFATGPVVTMSPAWSVS
jgi:hypothetical protein